ELVFHADGMVPKRTTVGALFGRPVRLEPREVELDPGRTLRGRVVDSVGLAVAATLEVHSLHQGGTLTFGRSYALANGGVWLRTSADAHGSFAVSGIGSDVEALQVSARAVTGEQTARVILTPPYPSDGVLIQLTPVATEAG